MFLRPRVRSAPLLLLAGLALACGGGGGGPKEPQEITGAAALYVNRTVGHYQEWSSTTAAGTETVRETVTASAGATLTKRTVLTRSSDVAEDDYVISSGALLWVAQRYWAGGVGSPEVTAVAPGYPLLGGDATPGATQTVSSVLSSNGTPFLTYTKTLTVNGVESVTVPAGTFSALRTTAVRTSSSGTTITIVTWWAEGVGVVRSESFEGAAATGTPISASLLTAHGT